MDGDEHQEDAPTTDEAPAPAMPNYLLEPNAVLLDDCRWRHGQVPDYCRSTKSLMKGQTVVHAAGSLEGIVSNLVRNWFKEVTYKTHKEDFRTIDTEEYKFSVNGGVKRGLTEMLEVGTYAALIGDQHLFCSSKTPFEEAHKSFRRSFGEGFSWEVVEVYSGPPKVSFKWRHWGRMTGPLTCPLNNGIRMCAKPTHEVVTISGIAVCVLSSDFKIQELEVYFDQSQPMSSMVHSSTAASKSDAGTSVDAKACKQADFLTQRRTSLGTSADAKACKQADLLTQRRTSLGMMKDKDIRNALAAKKAEMSHQSELQTCELKQESQKAGTGILGGLWNLLGG